MADQNLGDKIIYGLKDFVENPKPGTPVSLIRWNPGSQPPKGDREWKLVAIRGNVEMAQWHHGRWYFVDAPSEDAVDWWSELPEVPR